MSGDPTTRAIIGALVSALMETRTAGASDRQIMEAATNTFLSVACNLNAEEYVIKSLTRIQEILNDSWEERIRKEQERMMQEGVGMVRH